MRTLRPLIFLLALPVVASGEEMLIPADKANLSLRHEVAAAIGRGLAWFEKHQEPEGFWSNKEHPALTALVLTACLGAPERGEKQPAYVEKGLEFVAAQAKPDGGIYVEQMKNYNTAVSLLALHLSGEQKYQSVVKSARAYLVGMQAESLDNPALNGGIGYGPGGTNRQHPDLSNTLFALEALHYTRGYEQGENVPASQKLNWKAAIDFVSRCQNLPATNKEPWASDDPANRGGFVYFPGNSMAGEMELPGGKKALRSYGSMSYAGLLSMIYAEVDKNDPRVVAVMDWLKRNYTLDENPGMGGEGLFYYYHTMAKGLAATGVKELELEGGKKVDWRVALAKKLLDLQTADGSWTNEKGRWWEKDPALVTAYCVLALDVIYRAL